MIETKEGAIFLIAIGLTIYVLMLFTVNRIYKIKRGETTNEED